MTPLASPAVRWSGRRGGVILPVRKHFMVDWFSSVKRAVRSAAAPEAEPFELACRCGRSTQGLRSSQPQLVTCAQCGEQLLVFPVSRYPRPLPPQPKPAKKPKTPSKSKGTLPALSASQATVTLKSPPTASAAVSDSKSTAAVKSRPARSAERIGATAPVRKPRRVFTPLRIVGGVLAVVLTASGFWILRERERDLATQALSAALKAGRKALEEDDIPEADLQFENAVQALDRLGLHDRPAQAARQTARELAVMHQLTSHTLPELLGEAAKTVAASDADQWAKIFLANYHGSWVILDTVVTPLPAAEGATAADFLLEGTFSNGTEQLHGTLQSDGLREIPRDGRPHRLVLAVQMQEFLHDSGSPGHWLLRFNGNTCFLWTDASLLARLGWPVDDVTKKLLADQTQWLGLEH